MSEELRKEYKELLLVLYGKLNPMELANLSDSLGIMVGGHQEVIPRLMRCLTTGSPEAQKAARKAITEQLSELEDERNDGAYEVDPEERWDNASDYFAHPLLWNRTLRDWTLANLLSELKVPVSISDAIKNADTMSNYGSPIVAMTAESDEFWRGVAAVVISRSQQTAPMTIRDEDLPGFIEWAGTHPDIAAVIEVASQRATFSVENLQGIMDQGDVTPLRTGVL